MPSSSLILSLLTCTGPALATTHTFFAGVFSGSSIYSFTFDDTTSNLSLRQNITTNSSSSKWLAIDERHQNLYVADTGSWDSYSITSNLSLVLKNTIATSDSCDNTNYIVGATTEPYTVFGATYATGCSGTVISVDNSGVLQAVTSNMTYSNNSGVHGLALDAWNNFVYSADDSGDTVWVHSYDKNTGIATEVQQLSAPSDADPRHLAVHPVGKYVYVIFEAANELAVYSRDNTTGKLTYTNTTYPLIPSSFSNSSEYWSDEVVFSSNDQSPKYIYASSRSMLSSATGYVSAFSLDLNTGAMQQQLFLTPTTGSGGAANSVSAALFSEDYFAITDSESDFVEVWALNTNSTNVTASVVAHLDLDIGPANIVWYD